jgi:hypothetical protein
MGTAVEKLVFVLRKATLWPAEGEKSGSVV